VRCVVVMKEEKEGVEQEKAAQEGKSRNSKGGPGRDAPCPSSCKATSTFGRTPSSSERNESSIQSSSISRAVTALVVGLSGGRLVAVTAGILGVPGDLYVCWGISVVSSTRACAPSAEGTIGLRQRQTNLACSSRQVGGCASSLP